MINESVLLSMIESTNNSLRELIDTQISTIERISALETHNFALEQENKLLTEKLNSLINGTNAPSFKRRNAKKKTDAQYAPQCSVNMASIMFLQGAHKLLDENYEFVEFYSTDVAFVIMAKFSHEETKNSIKLSRNYAKWVANSTFAVKSVFGGVNPGDPTRFYNCNLWDGKKDSLLLWPNTEEFCLGEKKVTTIRPINIAPQSSKNPTAMASWGKLRFSQSAMAELGFMPAFAELDTSGKHPVIRFESVKTKTNYVCTHAKYKTKNQSVGTFEICSAEVLAKLGYNKKTMKAMHFKVVVSGCEAMLLLESITKAVD